MISGGTAKKRSADSSIDVLPRGALRVRVDSEIDRVTKKRYQSTE